jgi:hypothetical protein
MKVISAQKNKNKLYIAMKPKDNIVYEYEVQEKLAQTNKKRINKLKLYININ